MLSTHFSVPFLMKIPHSVMLEFGIASVRDVHYEGFEVFTAVTVKNAVFWGIKTYKI
jgi:hypothetical protein